MVQTYDREPSVGGSLRDAAALFGDNHFNGIGKSGFDGTVLLAVKAAHRACNGLSSKKTCLFLTSTMFSGPGAEGDAFASGVQAVLDSYQAGTDYPTAKLLFYDIFMVHGFPDQITSDSQQGGISLGALQKPRETAVSVIPHPRGWSRKGTPATKVG